MTRRGFNGCFLLTLFSASFSKENAVNSLYGL
jgi:hypothetical protein